MSLLKKFLIAAVTIPAIFLSLFILSAQARGQITLRACYFKLHESFGSVEDRAATAAKYGIWQYKGTSEQNIQLALLLCPPEDKLGFAVVTDYQKGLSSPMTQTQDFVPVTSLTLKDGTTFDISDLGGKVFLTIEPGATKEEIVLCTNISTTTSRFTNCTRGLAFKGSSVSGVSGNAQTHNSGSTVVMSNVHYVYQQFVDTNNVNQTIDGIKSFINFPKVTSTTAIPSTGDQLASKYYVDNVGAGGFTASNVSTTRGLSVDGSVPERVGINASSTGSTAFDSAGRLYVNPTFYLPATFIGPVIVPTPVSSTNPVTKSYSDMNLKAFVATGTADGTVVAGKALYVSSTGNYALTDTSAVSSTFAYVGLSMSSVATGTELSFTRPGGINCNQSGLTTGSQYFLSGVSGALATSPASGKTVPVGIAISSTCIQTYDATQMMSGTILHPAAGAGTQDIFTQIGFRPSAVILNIDGQMDNAFTYGNLVYHGSTQIVSNCWNEDAVAATALTTANIRNVPLLGSSGVGCYAKSSAADRGHMVITLNSVSNSGITTRIVNTTDNGAGVNSQATITYIAFK